MRLILVILIAAVFMQGCTFVSTRELTYASMLKDIEATKTVDPNGIVTLKISGKQSPDSIDAAVPLITGMAMYIVMGL